MLKLEEFSDEVESLVDLFALYLVAHKIKSGAMRNKTAGYNVYRLMESDKTALSQLKIEEKKDEIKSHLLSELSPSKMEKEIQRAKNLIQKSPLKFISGKSYLMPLILNRLKAKTKFSGTIDQLKIRMARYCDIGIDKGLVSAVIGEAQRKF